MNFSKLWYVYKANGVQIIRKQCKSSFQMHSNVYIKLKLVGLVEYTKEMY